MASNEAPTDSSQERLLAAGKKLMATNGYERTSTSAIVREAGTSESQLMRYFGGKAGLLKAIFEEDWTPLNKDLQCLIDEKVDIFQALKAVLDIFIDALDRDPDTARLFLFEGRRLRGHRKEVTLSEGFVTFINIVQELIKRGQEQNEIDPTLSSVAVSAGIVGLAEGMIRDRLVLAELNGHFPFAEADLRCVYTTMIHGLQVKPAP